MKAVSETIESLPDGWEMLTLGEAYEFSKKPRSLEIRDKDMVPFIPMDSISEGSKSIKGWQMKKMSEVTSGTFVLKNDLMIAKITPSFENGKQAILDNLPQDYGYATTEVWAIHPKNNHHLTDYLFNYIRIQEVRHGLATKMEGATGRQRLPRNVLESQPIAFPPFEEQKKIASVLLSLQESKEKTQNVLSTLKELKKSMMKHLFTFGAVSIEEIDKVKLKDTEIGLMPENWNTLKVEDVITLSQYGMSVRGNPQGKYPIMRMNSMQDGRLDLTNLQYVDVDDAMFEKFKLKKGDILFNRTNSYELVGKVAMFDVDIPFVFASYIVRLTVDSSKILPLYLNYYLNWLPSQNRLRMLASRGVSQSNINATKLKEFDIPLPSLPEQEEIAKTLSTIDGKIKTEENKKNSLAALYNTLLSLLMTGKLRVKDLVI
jgi:type I restriction enzyme, S subunit